MKETKGHITLVQEDRFRLATLEGQSLLLTLFHDSRLKPHDLFDWYRDGTSVVVEYEGEAGLESGTAHSIRTL